MITRYLIAASVIVHLLSSVVIFHYKNSYSALKKTSAVKIEKLEKDNEVCLSTNGNLVLDIERQNKSILAAKEEQKLKDIESAKELEHARKAADYAKKRGTQILIRERKTADACADARNLFDEVVKGEKQ